MYTKPEYNHAYVCHKETLSGYLVVYDRYDIHNGIKPNRYIYFMRVKYSRSTLMDENELFISIFIINISIRDAKPPAYANHSLS